jgi:DNA-binding transcriptional MerR regulator
MAGDLLTAKAAARKLGVSPKTLRGWVLNDIIPVWSDPVTGRRRFSVLELDDVLRTLGRDQAKERQAS